MIGSIIAKKAVAGAFSAMNNKDLDKFMSTWADDGVFIYPGDIPQSGVFEGKAKVRAWFKGFFEQFPGLTFEVLDIAARNSFDLLGNNVLIIAGSSPKRKSTICFTYGYTCLNTGTEIRKRSSRR